MELLSWFSIWKPDKDLCEKARKLGREFVVQAKGKVRERSNKNLKMPTGEIEIDVDELNILNRSEIPPFTIEEDTDGGEELRMKYRYLDLRQELQLKITFCFVTSYRRRFGNIWIQ